MEKNTNKPEEKLQLSQKKMDLLFETTKNIFENNIPLYSIQNLSPDSMEALYFVAYEKYRLHDLEQAITLFRYLCFMDNMQAKYWLGLAKSYEQNKQYKKAMEAYSLLLILDEDPIPYTFKIASCFIELGDTSKAAALFKNILYIHKRQPTKMQWIIYKTKQILRQIQKGTSKNAKT